MVTIDKMEPKDWTNMQKILYHCIYFCLVINTSQWPICVDAAVSENQIINFTWPKFEIRNQDGLSFGSLLQFIQFLN
jgi:hypothetical protein